MINGHTELIAHIGFPTHTFKSPMIYNPYFNEAGINAVVVPMGCRPEHYGALLKSVFLLENLKKNGMLVTSLPPAEVAILRDKMKPVIAKHGEVIAATVTELQAELAKLRK